jgi:hypothetical protein
MPARSRKASKSPKSRTKRAPRRRASANVFRSGGTKMVRVTAYVRKLGRLPPRNKGGRFSKRGQGSLF